MAKSEKQNIRWLASIAKGEKENIKYLIDLNTGKQTGCFVCQVLTWIPKPGADCKTVGHKAAGK